MDYWEIIKGGPLPAMPTRSAARFPLQKLQVGEWFIVPSVEQERLRRAAANFNARHKYGDARRVSVRLIDSGIWCGRIK